MPDIKSEPYPQTDRVLLILSDTLPCSPNSLPMVFKAISTHGSQTSSPVAVNVWPKMEFFHPLFLSRLEFLKAAFWPLFFFWFSSMISKTLLKILFISLLMTPLSAIPSVIPQTGKQQLLPSLQIWVKSQTGPTRGTYLSIWTNLTLSRCLSERTIWKTPPSTFSTILWKKSFLSSFWVSLSAIIFPGKPHFLPGLQSQLLTGNPPSCKVLLWPT